MFFSKDRAHAISLRKIVLGVKTKLFLFCTKIFQIEKIDKNVFPYIFKMSENDENKIGYMTCIFMFFIDKQHYFKQIIVLRYAFSFFYEANFDFIFKTIWYLKLAL